MRADNYYPGFKGQMQWARDDLLLNNPFGEVFYVDYLNGSDSDDGKTPDSAFKTLGQAHTAVTTNKGDTIYLNGSTGTHIQEAAMLTWSKNRVSVIGIGPAGAADPQPEIQLSSTANAADNAATIKVTGHGNSFTNCYFMNAGTHTNSVTALWDAGENNIYTNCQFAKITDLGVAGVSHVEARGDTTTWRNCKFGVDWVLCSAARYGVNIKGTGGSARMKHNIFEDCYFVVATDDGDYEHVHVYNTSSLAFNNIWKNCTFSNCLTTSIGAVACDDAVNSVAGLVEGSLFFVNPACNSTSFSSTANQLTVVANSMADSGNADVAPVMGVAQTPS